MVPEPQDPLRGVCPVAAPAWDADARDRLWAASATGDPAWAW
ncbi:hypothetical protein [Nonomuraea sp. NPDC050643]